MPWKPCLLRGKRVWARCKPDGTLEVQDGRVEIRYAPKDGRAYRASPKNLVPIEGPMRSDDSFGLAEFVENQAREAKIEQAILGAFQCLCRGEESKREVIVYADGASSGNPGPAGIGVLIIDGEKCRELSEYLGITSNNVAELTAIRRALEALEGETRPVCLRTDSQYAIGVLQGGWKAKTHLGLIAEVQAAMRKLQVQLEHVRGHQGVWGNERADALARLAVRKQQSRGWQLLNCKTNGGFARSD
ncbi:MAG: ribonuclease HI [Deltaproteobacteria bacterium]|nr:ribonuclease HI [Deltaproteobacteria bacterium]MDW8247248.1 ribonuclease H [Sandaracinaceae bacterium]